MGQYVLAKLGASDFGEELWSEYETARKRLGEVEAKMRRDFPKSQRGKMFQSMGAVFSGHGYGCASLKFTNGAVELSFAPIRDHMRDKNELPSPLSISEKTINVLLHGSLLTDDEKKKLIKRLAPDLLDEADSEAA